MNGSTAIRVGAACVMRGRGYAGAGIIINMWRIGERIDENIDEQDPTEIYDIENGYGQPTNGGDE